MIRLATNFHLAVSLLTLLAFVAAGCGSDKPAPAKPAKAEPKKASAGTPAAGSTPKADTDSSGNDSLAAALKRAKREGYANAATVKGFVDACKKRPKVAIKAAGDRTAGYGAVHRGKVLKPGLKTPPSNSFAWTQRAPEYLDPNLISGSPGHSIAINLFEPLLAPAAGNEPPVPGAAERFEVSKDGLTYTFFLRKGNVWSDGTPLTAQDFKFAWLRGLAPETGSKNAQQIYLYLVGAEGYNNGSHKDPSKVAIKVIDDHTISLKLKHPTPFFPELLTYIAWAPVPRHTIAKHGKQWTRPGNIVVNGPYTLTEFEPRSKVVLTKNPKYWDAANVAIERSDVFMTDSEDRNATYYQTGQVHLAQPLSPDKVRAWLKDGRSDLHIDQHMCTYYLALRNGRAPFNDPLVREALTLAIDRERLAKHVLGRLEQPASHFIPDMFEATLGYKAVPGSGHDPEEAKRLLAEAGYPNGSGFPSIELRYNTLEVNRQVAEFVQRSLLENLGVKVTLHNMEWKSMLKTLRTGEFQLGRAAWCADYADPMTFFEVLRSTAAVNYTRYNNPNYDALLKRIGTTVSRDERNALLCAAEKTLNHDRPILPLFFYTHAYLLHPSVKGWKPQYQNTHLLKYLKLQP